MTFHRALLVSICLLAAAAALVPVAYFFIDRPVAFWVRDHHLPDVHLLKWLTFIPPLLEQLAPAVLVYAALQRTRRPLNRLETTLLASAVSLVVTLAINEDLKGVFGRYWPGTWIHDNPSLLRDGAYGFHFFQWGEAYGSFPSGHTARICAVVSVFWVAWPRTRPIDLLLALAVVVGLVGMNYHFVGDTLGGACVGSVIGLYTSCFFGLGREMTRIE